MGMDVSGSGTPGHALGDEEEILAVANAWVTNALVSVSKNNGANYMRMLNDLREVDLDDSSKISALKFRLKALAQSVYFINERVHQALLDQVLGMSLWLCDGAVADIILEFVVNLATANGGCVGQCIDMLVRNFLPPSCGLPAFLDAYSKARLGSGRLSMDKIRSQQNVHLARKEDVLGRLHNAIKQISSLVPTTPLRMLPVVLKRMPHRSAAKEWNLLYLENMLRLESSGGRYFASQMLPAVIDLLIQIDVEIRWEDIVKEEAGSVFVFHMDLEEEIEVRGPDANEAEEADRQSHAASTRASQSKLSTLDEMANKMDLMMDMMLEHLQFSVQQGRCLQVYDTLMKSFQSAILHTHRSKFTQFLIFYLCSLEPNTCGSRFANLLCDIITARTHSPTTRISAAAYLASYLARARFLSASVISASLVRLVSWCISYGADDVKHHDAAVSDAVLHGVFFAVCQAVMYTLCFRFRMLNDDVDGKRVLRGLHLQKLVNHRLGPLKVCLPSVVEEFLRRARVLQLVDQRTWFAVKEFVERRSQNNESLGDSRLDMFFPFDPYLLQRSDRFIRPNYNSWSMVQSLEENDESDFGGSDDDGDSDVSSDMENKTPVYSLSPASQVGSFGRKEEDHFVEATTKSASLNISRHSFAGELDYSRAGTSPYSDEEFVDSFQNSFDAMAITPPHSQKMPAKLPAQLPAEFSHSFHM